MGDLPGVATLSTYPLAVGTGITRVLEAGPGEAAVLFLHGVGARADRWKSTLAACATSGLHAYAIDFPGHGFASKGADLDHSVKGLSDFVIRAVQELGLEKVALVGTSLGGHVAATVRLMRPDLVSRVVFVGPIGIVPIGADSCAALADAVLDTTRTGIARKLQSLVYDTALVSEAWILEEFRTNNSPGARGSFESLSAYFRDSIDEDAVGDRLRRTAGDMPCLLVWGAEDQMVPPHLAEEVLAQLPERTRYVQIADAGHAPYLEAPAVFNALIIDFLRHSR